MGIFDQINTDENLEWRAKALEIHDKVEPGHLPLTELKQMLGYLRLSLSPVEVLEDIIDADLEIVTYVLTKYPEATLDDLRDLFRERAFPDNLVNRWVNSSANIRALTANTLLIGYPEYLVSTTPDPYWEKVDGIEYMRRRFLEGRTDEFNGFYGHNGK